MKVGNINLFFLIVKISTAKSFDKFPLAWQGGFPVVVAKCKKTQLLVSFFSLDMQGRALLLVRRSGRLRRTAHADYATLNRGKADVLKITRNKNLKLRKVKLSIILFYEQ